MYGGVPHGVWTGGQITQFTIANLTIRGVYGHALVFNAGTQAPRVYNVRLVDAGEQFIKANPDEVAGTGVDDGVVEYSIVEYTTTARDGYTNGVDIHRGRRWVVRSNLFRNIRAPQGQLAGPAVLAWNGSSATVIERNTFVNCQRAISLGLTNERAFADHTGGVIRNNFISRTAAIEGDVAIAVMDSPDTQVLHNTVLLGDSYPNALEFRFPRATGILVENNLANRSAATRDGATAVQRGNVWTATAALFVDPSVGDLTSRPRQPARSTGPRRAA